MTRDGTIQLPSGYVMDATHRLDLEFYLRITVMPDHVGGWGRYQFSLLVISLPFAFLLAYAAAVALVGAPLLLLEVGMDNHFSKGFSGR